jgi:hypothetical protein
MKKHRPLQFGFFNSRTLAAVILCSIAASLTWLSSASSEPNATTAFGGPDTTVPGNPRYQNFYPPAGSSAEPGSGEFNIGFNPFSKHIFVMNAGAVWRLTPPEFLTPAKSECCDALWEDKSAHSTNNGLDPIIWTDQKTGRTFASNLTAGANFVYAYTDGAAPFNDGDVWVEAGASPPNGGADHETLGSGPYPAALPWSGLATPVNQGEAVYYCSQDIVGPAFCQRSDDLGASYGSGVLAYNGFTTACGGLHGHLHVASNGTVWLPVNQCGGQQGGAVSTTAGSTWTEFIVSGNNDVAGGAEFSAASQANGADPSIAIDAANTAYYCYVNDEGGSEGHVHVAVSTDGGQTWIRDVDVGVSHGIVNAAHTEAVGGSAGRAACGFIGTNITGNYQSGSFPGLWYAFIATTYDQGRTWVTVNATPNDPVQNHTGIWQQGGSGENGDRNLLDFNEITIDEKGRALYGYSDGCHTETCINGNNLGSGLAPNVDRGPYLERGAFMRVARQSGGKPLLAQFDPTPAEPAAPKAPCFSATRDCAASHLSWKAPDNGGADITGYAILRGTTAGGETVLVANTGNLNTTFDDPVDPSVRHYFYVVKAINTQGAGVQSSEIDLSSELLAFDDSATTSENQPVLINVLANDCGTPPLTLIFFSNPSHGSLTYNADSTLTYTPANGFFGLDSFIYTVSNGSGATATRTVHISVSPLCSLVNTGSFIDTFESGAPGWTVETPKNNIPASHAWTVVPDSSAHSPTMSFKSDSTTLDLKDDRLISPPQKLSTTSHLKFWHRYQFEDGYDGGAVEVSTDGGATWVDVLAGGGNFVSSAYNGHISPSYGSPIAGRPAWTGGDATAAMSQVDIDLGAFAGFNVRVRFHLACDMFLAGSQPGVGWWIDDVQFTNTLVEGPCPNVVSRKAHGLAGSYDINLPQTGTAGIECRSGGANNSLTLVYSLAANLSSPGTATVTQGSATVGTPTIGPNPFQVTVPLTNVANPQHLVVTLNGVKDTSNVVIDHLVARIDMLAGDTTADGVVNSADIAQTKSQSGNGLTSVNFREDVTADGNLNSADIGLVKSKSGTGLP